MKEIIYSFLGTVRFNLFIIFFLLNVINLFKKILFDKFTSKLFCYIFISISLSGIILFLIDFENSIIRFSGKYSLISWLLLLSSSLSPFFLLIEKFRNKIYSFLIISFLMNIGRIFEFFIILVTSFHRDYL